MWTVSDLSLMKKAYLVEGNDAIGGILTSESVLVRYIPRLWEGKPDAARDLGFFHKNKFYGHSPIPLDLECKVHEASDGGGIISDGNIAFISNTYDMYPWGGNKIDKIEKELDMEVQEVDTGGVHIDYFINFLSSSLAVFHKGLAEGFFKGKAYISPENHKLIMRGFYKALEKLRDRRYSIYEIGRNFKGSWSDFDAFIGFGKSLRLQQEYQTGWGWPDYCSMLANIVPIRDGTVIMIKDLPKEITDIMKWEHIPTALNKIGIRVYEIEAQNFRAVDGAGTGPRCRILPKREV